MSNQKETDLVDARSNRKIIDTFATDLSTVVFELEELLLDKQPYVPKSWFLSLCNNVEFLTEKFRTDLAIYQTQQLNKNNNTKK